MQWPNALLEARDSVECLLRDQGFLGGDGGLENLRPEHAQLVLSRVSRVLEAARSHAFRMQWVAAGTAHHELGPSAFPHWRRCAYWEGCATSLAAEKGTANHAALNALLLGASEENACEGLEPSASEDVRWAADSFRRLLGPLAVFEHRVAFACEEVFFAGTLDGASDLAVADFKSGLPPRDYDHADQIAGYCAAWMQERWWIDEMKGWVVFGRARRSRASWWTYESAKARAMDVVRRRMNRSGEATGGDSCSLCALALRCPTWLQAHQAGAHPAHEPMDRLRLPLPDFVRDPKAAAAMARVYLVTKRWVPEAGKALNALAASGMAIPGLGVSERAGAQHLRNPEDACSALGLSTADLLREFKVTAAAMARALSRKRGITEAAARDIVEADCELTTGRAHLSVHSEIF